MVLPDVNVLVYAHREDTANHVAIRAWLEGVVNGDEAYAISDLVLSGFVRVVTHPKVFKRPSNVTEALAFAEQLREQPNCVRVEPGPRHTSTTNSGPLAVPCVKLAMAAAPKSCTAMPLMSPPGSRLRSSSRIQSARAIGLAARAPTRSSKSSVSNAPSASASALRTAVASAASFSRKSLTSLVTVGTRPPVGGSSAAMHGHDAANRAAIASEPANHRNVRVTRMPGPRRAILSGIGLGAIPSRCVYR